MLTSCIMVRRLKKDVLSQLPPKRRTQVETHLLASCYTQKMELCLTASST